MRKDNTIGNTYSNLFDNMQNVEFFSVYGKSGRPNQKFVSRCFHITEKELIKNLLNKNYSVGQEIEIEDENDKIFKNGKLLNTAKKLRFEIFFFIRDFIWKIGRWKSKELKTFIEDVNPDLIFAPLDNSIPLNNLVQYVQKHLNCKLALYAWDDMYTLNCFSLSPFFWLKRFHSRKIMRKTVKQCNKLYVISEKQKQVYEKSFNCICEVLYKGFEFNEKPKNSMKKSPLKLLFTGNLAYGRYIPLAMIARALQNINKDGVKAQLYVYSQTPLKKSVIAKLNVDNSSFFMGAISHKETMRMQNEADILLHVESFEKSTKSSVWLSFSTKLVDYFYQSKCVFAVGPSDVASIDYLIKNDAAIVVTNKNEIEDKLRLIVENPDIVSEYGVKAWECGKGNHQIKEIQNRLYRDFEDILNENSSN